MTKKPSKSSRRTGAKKKTTRRPKARARSLVASFPGKDAKVIFAGVDIGGTELRFVAQGYRTNDESGKTVYEPTSLPVNVKVL